MAISCYYFILLALAVSVNCENEYTDIDSAQKCELEVILYQLNITTSEANFEDKGDNTTFKGLVKIDFLVSSSQPNCYAEIDISPDMKIEKLDIEGIKWNKTQNKIVLIIDKNFFKENISAKIDYEGSFGKDMSGFYRSSYKDASKKNRWILTSHFEPIYARRAFPCFDKPKLKARFALFFTVPKKLINQGYHVLSNTPCKMIKNELFKCNEINDKMSTYLLAFTISDLKSTTPKNFTSKLNVGKYGSHRKITTYGQDEMIKYGGDLTVEVGAEALKLLTDYLGIGYAFEKVDQVGIPDFSAGAMENWGLILFREKILFHNEKTGSILTKQSNILTIVHELVHQWFGNLVTLETWDYIWLNEAFATYFQYYISNKFTLTNPNIKTWKYAEQHVVKDIHLRAFETDALKSTKCMSHHIEDENLVFSFFNDINYSKGSAILRMWDLSLPEKKFQESLKDYVKNRQFQSANPGHLLQSLKKIGGIKDEFFKTWTENPGYPVVTVTKKGNDEFELSQNRFFYEKLSQENKTTYFVPISFYTNTEKNISTRPVQWLYKDNIKIKAKGNWIIVNTDQAGYYRVNYDENNWNALAVALKEKDFSKIRELNRAQIVNDIFSLARSNQKNYVKYVTALNLALYLKNENSFVTWKTALQSFEFLQNKLYTDDKIYPGFEAYVLDLIRFHYKGLSVSGLEHVEKLKAIEIAQWACKLNYKNCTEEAKKLYDENKIPPDTQEIILCTVVRTNKAVINDILKKYEAENDSALKVMYLNALGCSEDKKFISSFLQQTFNATSGIRKQDTIYVITSVINGNLKNVQTVYSFIKSKYKEIAREYGGIDPLGRAVTSIAKKLNSDQDLADFKTLLKNIKDNESTKPSVQNAENALGILQGNVLWLKEKKGEFSSYFPNSGSFLGFSFALLSACLIFVFQF